MRSLSAPLCPRGSYLLFFELFNAEADVCSSDLLGVELAERHNKDGQTTTQEAAVRLVALRRRRAVHSAPPPPLCRVAPWTHLSHHVRRQPHFGQRTIAHVHEVGVEHDEGAGAQSSASQARARRGEQLLRGHSLAHCTARPPSPSRHSSAPLTCSAIVVVCSCRCVEKTSTAMARPDFLQRRYHKKRGKADKSI